MDVKRAASERWHRVERAGKACGRAWRERAEDGRVRYAMAGLGLGLIAGSLLTAAADTVGLIDWESFGPAPITFLGFVVGLGLFLIALYPRSWSGQIWSWAPRTLRQRILTRATEDSKFRAQLRADPDRTIEREFPVTLRDGCEVTVLEETMQHVYIVLPVQPSELLRAQPDATSEVEAEDVV